MYRKKIVDIGFNTLHGFKHSVRVFTFPVDKRDYSILNLLKPISLICGCTLLFLRSFFYNPDSVLWP